MNVQRSPRIGIVTVTLNNADGLLRSLESIKAQVLKPAQVIVVDGGSRDLSLQVIRNFDDLIHRWVSEPDQGIYDAMNKGVAMIDSDYILFLNAGDCLSHSNVLQIVSDHISKTSADLYYADFEADYGNGRRRLQKSHSLQNIWKGMPTSHQSMLARRSDLLSHPFNTTYLYSGDFEFVFWLYRENRKFEYIPHSLAVIEAGGVSHFKYSTVLKANYKILRPTVSGSLKIKYGFNYFCRLWIQQALETALSLFSKRQRLNILYHIDQCRFKTPSTSA